MGEEEEEEQRIREEAEARRQRVLQKSKDRMNKVAGLQQDADADDEETKTSSAARMAAMRRRRFKKNKDTKDKDSSADAVEQTEADEDDKKEDDAAPAAAEEKPAAAVVESEAPKEEAAPSNEEAAAATSTTEESTSSEPKKKYMGVAKMRRAKAMAKRKEDAAKSDEDFKCAGDSPAVKARRLRKARQPMLPILMYILTTFLLFLAGLDVGLQHADVETIIVNRDFAPKQFTFSKLNPWSNKKVSIEKLVVDDNSAVYTRALNNQDEFGGGGEDTGDEDNVPNIDPIFQVDLDELTRGPGIVNQLGRGAVKIHRMILYVPMALFSLSQQLLKYPPMMALAALTIRQVIAKYILGAKLPNNIEEDVRNAKEMQDILTMAKNAVKNTITNTFPTAVSLWEAFQLLRTDMYVVLCGVFCGLLYASWLVEHTPSGLEETVYDDIPVNNNMPVDGASDEL